jgi:hypothetical protein
MLAIIDCMTKSFSFNLIFVLIGLTACGQCDHSQLLKANRQPAYANTISTPDEFYDLSKEQNRELWFAELESPNKTTFTRFWDSYHENNYRISQSDFIQNYSNSKDIILAFQLGPNILNMSSYDIFTARKIGDCYLLVRTYVSHDRINGKSYSVFNKSEFQSLTEYLNTNTHKVEKLSENLDQRIDKNTLFMVNNLDLEIKWINVFNEYDEPDEDGFTPINESNPAITELFELLNSSGKWSEAE